MSDIHISIVALVIPKEIFSRQFRGNFRVRRVNRVPTGTIVIVNGRDSNSILNFWFVFLYSENKINHWHMVVPAVLGVPKSAAQRVSTLYLYAYSIRDDVFYFSSVFTLRHMVKFLLYGHLYENIKGDSSLMSVLH